MKLNQYQWDPQADQIGEGTFAEVFKATDNNGDPVALKIYRDSVIKGLTSGSFNGKYSLESEFAKGKHLSHTNVIRYIGFDYIVHTNFMGQQVSYPVLIMEYADTESLELRLQRAYPLNENSGLTTDVLKTEEILTIGHEILEGLTYLHEQGIIHRDLKPANILFKTDRRGHPVAKITDFGISRDILEQSTTGSTANVGTISYMAPEQFMPKTFGVDGNISNGTDIWAVGVILHRMFTGKLPFNSPEAITDVEPDYGQVPLKYRALLKGCLQKHAAKRFPDVKAVLETLNNARQPVKLGWYEKNKRIIHWTAAIVLTMTLCYRVAFYISNGPDTAKYVTNMILKQTDTVNGESFTYTYTGWLKNGEPNGMGTYLFKDGDKYSGESKNGHADGKGIMYYKVDGGYDTVEGEFKNGKPNGLGTLLSKNGDKYIGQFKNGLPDGKGKGTSKVEGTFEGNFKNGDLDGSGTLLSINGDKYVGQFKNGKPDGSGTLLSVSGDKYVGQFKNGFLDGSGTYQYINGDKYVGQFKDGFKEGHGLWYINTDGQFKGDKYDGEFVNGNYQGIGTYYFRNGTKYEGDFKNGLPNGSGKMYDNSGNLSESGNYLNGVLQK